VTQLPNTIEIVCGGQIPKQEAFINKRGSERFPFITLAYGDLIVENISRGGLNKVKQQTEKCGFSRPVISYQTKTLAPRNFKLLNIQHTSAAVNFRKVSNCNHLIHLFV